MNGKQRRFLRDIAKNASLLATCFDAAAAAGAEEPLYVLLWRAMPFLPVSAREHTEGLMRGAAADDCFEISDWFECIRHIYGKYSQVLTLCQLLCCAWRSYEPDGGAAELYRREAELLRLLAAAVTAGVNTDKPPDLSAVWWSMIKHRRCLFGGDVGARRRLLLTLECSIGTRRSDRQYRQPVREFLAADAGLEPEEHRKIFRGSAVKLYLGLAGACAGPVREN